MKFTGIALRSMKADIIAGNNPFLAGEAGIGKSSFVLDLENETDHKFKVFSVAVNQMTDKADVTGQRMVPANAEKTEWVQRFFPREDIAEALNFAEENPDHLVIIDLEEINRSNPDVTSAVMTMLTERRLGHRRFTDNIRFVLTGNINGDVVPLDSAKITRMRVYEMAPDKENLVRILSRSTNRYPLHPLVRMAIEDDATSILERSKPRIVNAGGSTDSDSDSDYGATEEDLFDNEETMVQWTCPRTIDYINAWMNETDQEMWTEMIAEPADTVGATNLLHESIISQLGDTTLSAKLMSLIMHQISNAASGANGNAPVITLKRPTSYSKLAKATSISELEELVAELDVDEMSASIVYALSDQDNRSDLIRTLVTNMGTNHMNPDDKRDLARLMSAQMHNMVNVDSLESITDPIPLLVDLRPIIDTLK